MKFSEKYPAIPKIVKGALITLGAFLIIWFISWQIFCPKRYIFDTSLGSSEFLQIFVISIAIMGPLVTYINNRNKMPVVSIRTNEPPFLDGKKAYYTSEGLQSKTETNPAKIIYLIVTNKGKSRLLNCEIVLLSIDNKINNDNHEVFDQKPLKWIDGPFRKDTVEINPGREMRLGLAFFDSRIRDRQTKSDDKLKVYDSHDEINKYRELEFGEYVFHLKAFSSNADIKTFDCIIKYSKESLSNDRWGPKCEISIEEKETIVL